jgi:hypothetical protein
VLADRSLWIGCILALLVGAGLQLFFLDRGFLSISWDEAGRTLDAYSWAERGTVAVWVWLPFNRVVVGLALRIFPDLIVTPRVISGLFGLVAIPAMGWLAHELFEDRRNTLLTLALGALFSQRLALSVAPASAIMFIVFVLSGLALFAQWLRTGRSSALYACAGSVAIAGIERFEAWLFGAAILLAVWLHPPRPNFKRLLPFVLVLFIFPVGMLGYYVFISLRRDRKRCPAVLLAPDPAKEPPLRFRDQQQLVPESGRARRRHPAAPARRPTLPLFRDCGFRSPGRDLRRPPAHTFRSNGAILETGRDLEHAIAALHGSLPHWPRAMAAIGKIINRGGHRDPLHSVPPRRIPDRTRIVVGFPGIGSGRRSLHKTCLGNES